MKSMRLKGLITVVFSFVLGFLLFADDGNKDLFTVQPLKDLAAPHQLLIGAAVTRGKLRTPAFKEVLLREYNALTPENELKFDALKRVEDSYNFGPADEIVNFGAANGFKVRGHTLVWHAAVPAWFRNKAWTRDTLLAFLKDYITTVVTHYKGKIAWWDVVNEVCDDAGRLRDGSSSFWYGQLGDEYIEQAFRWAHKADPDAKLFINDYGVETVNPKSTGLYELVKKLLAKGVPVQGFGMQAHMTEEGTPDFASVAANIKRFTDLGLEVHITELDVRMRGAGDQVQLKHQAEIYRGFIKTALANPRVTCVTTWGISDADSWIPGVFPGYDLPLLFDRQYRPKPAFFAVAEALSAKPAPKAPVKKGK
jgi:endo-1,4-beta-xylanase